MSFSLLSCPRDLQVTGFLAHLKRLLIVIYSKIKYLSNCKIVIFKYLSSMFEVKVKQNIQLVVLYLDYTVPK